MQGWEWLNQNTWVASALLVIAFGGAALTMAWHIVESRSSKAGYLVVAGLAVLSVSFVLAGVTVGENPIVNDRALIPLIRILWFVAAVLLDSFMVLYWSERVRWAGRMNNELPEAGD